MMNEFSTETKDFFFTILRTALSGGSFALPACTDEQLNEVLAIARRQDVFHLACCGIKKSGRQLPANLEQRSIAEVYHYTQNRYLLERAREILSGEKIRYMPLKGAVIQSLYPEPWMRSGCDVDILVHEEDLEKAVRALVNGGFHTDEKKEYHDISLYYGGAHLELHYNIRENIPRIDGMLSRVWQYAEPVSDNAYEYRETGAFFAFHTLAHLLYHFLRGGCSVKQFADLWLLRRKGTYAEKDLQPLLADCRLEKFYRVVCDVTDTWFGDREPTELSGKIGDQVLRGGLAGANALSDAISLTVGGGMTKYILNSLFLPLREMKWIYPALEKHPCLLPLYYVHRLFTKTIGKDRKRARDVLKASKQPQTEAEALLKEMGLS